MISGPQKMNEQKYLTSDVELSLPPVPSMALYPRAYHFITSSVDLHQHLPTSGWSMGMPTIDWKPKHKLPIFWNTLSGMQTGHMNTVSRPFSNAVVLEYFQGQNTHMLTYSLFIQWTHTEHLLNTRYYGLHGETGDWSSRTPISPTLFPCLALCISPSDCSWAIFFFNKLVIQ